MVKQALKRILSMGCVAAILMTTPGTTLLADNALEGTIVSETSDDSPVVSVAEESVQEVVGEELSVEKDNSADNSAIDINESSQAELIVEDAEDGSSTEEVIFDLAEERDTDSFEETIGANTTWTVGDGVTATLVKEGSKDVLYFDSKGGTLWNGWPNECWYEVIGNMAGIVDIIKFSESSTVMYLPEDSSYLFGGKWDCKFSSLEEIVIDKVDTSNVIIMDQMFCGCCNLKSLDLKSFNTSNVRSMNKMFYDCSSLESLDLSSFNTSNVRNMDQMFCGCSSLTALDLSMFNTSRITNMSDLFFRCSSLTALDLSSFDTSKVTSMSCMFSRCNNLNALDLSRFDTSNVTDMSYMFASCKCLTQLDLDNFDTQNVTSMICMFYNCSSLDTLDVSSFDTSYVRDMCNYDIGGMFENCSSLISLDLSNFDTYNVTDMSLMFHGCTELTELKLSSFDTSKVEDMSYMFSGCSGLSELEISNFDTSKVTRMYEMFKDCDGLRELKLSSFDTSKVTDMIYMFSGCSGLIKLSLSNFNTSKVTDMYGMFKGCSGLTELNLSSFNTSEVTDMAYMFSDCSGLSELNFDNFDTSKVTDTAYMFSGCCGLKELDLSSFDMSSTEYTTNMFSGDLRKLKTPKKYNINHSINLANKMCDDLGQSYYELSDLTKSIVLYYDMTACYIKLSSQEYVYDGNEKEPTVSVLCKGASSEMISGEDYKVSFQDNKNAGTALVRVTGIGLCRGEKTTTFTISRAPAVLRFKEGNINKTSLDAPFTNELIKPSDADVRFNSSDHNVATVNASSGQVTIKGIGKTIISVMLADDTNYISALASYTLTVTSHSIEKASVGGVSLSYGYSGKAYTPTVTVKIDGKTLTTGTDYTVKYENNVKPGTAKITVTGKGKYTGTKTKTFEIVDCVSSVVSGKTYLLIPKNNAKTAVCAIGGKMVNNTKVYITDRGNSESQKFKAVKNSDGTWKFINAKCELALAVQQNSSALGAGLVLYDQTTRPAQNWKLSKKSDNSFAIINSVTGYSIAMSDKSAVKGTTLSMAETASVGLQRFYIVETSAVSAPFDGTKSIRAAKDKNFAVNIASSSKEDGANVSLYTYTNSNARKFKIIYSGGGYYRLVNVNSGLCLTVKDNSNADGANIIQSKWNGYSGQRWKIKKNSDGTVTITNMFGTVLHLLGNRTVNNTNIHARKAASTTAQKWYLN